MRSITFFDVTDEYRDELEVRFGMWGDGDVAFNTDMRAADGKDREVSATVFLNVAQLAKLRDAIDEHLAAYPDAPPKLWDDHVR